MARRERRRSSRTRSSPRELEVLAERARARAGNAAAQAALTRAAELTAEPGARGRRLVAAADAAWHAGRAGEALALIERASAARSTSRASERAPRGCAA